MKNFSWRQWAAVIAFVLALMLTGLFAARTVRHALYWHNHKDEIIRPWMNVPYISHSYRVPPHVLNQAINLQPTLHDRRPLREIAREQNRPVETLIAQLQDAIVHARPPYPPPPPPPQPPTSNDGGRAP
jgi:hypothetical protein